MIIQPNDLYFNNLNEFITVAGCVRIFENLWFEGDSTVEIINNECSSVYSSSYWIKQKDYNTFPLTQCLENNTTDFLFNYHNDVNNITNVSLKEYIKYYNITDNLNVSNINVILIKPNTKTHILTNGILTGLLFLNTSSIESNIFFKNFGLNIRPEQGVFTLIPSSFPYQFEITTGEFPLYFFQASIDK